MRSLFKFIIAALILTACSQTPILPTATQLPSMTSTSIPIVTPTFSPTLTSTPPVPDLTSEQQAWETHFAGSAHVSADGIVMSNEGVVIEGLKIDGTHATFTHAYPELDGDEFTIVMDIDDVKINEDGSIDMLGFTFDGTTMVQEHAVDDNGKETAELKVPYDVVVEMILRESTGTMDRRESVGRAREYLGLDGKTPSIRSNGVQYATIGSFVGSSEIYVVDANGKVIEKKETIFYAFEQLRKGNQSVVAFQKDGNLIKVFVDAKLGKKIYPLVKVQRSL